MAVVLSFTKGGLSMGGENLSGSPLSPDQVAALQKSAEEAHRDQGVGYTIPDTLGLGLDALKAAGEMVEKTVFKKK
jgi:hypothetical protein